MTHPLRNALAGALLVLAPPAALSGAARAGSSAQDPPRPTDRPPLAVDEEIHDFGVVSDRVLRRRFVLRNEGARACDLLRVELDPARVLLDYERGPLAPGAERVLEVAWRPGGTGRCRADLVVVSDGVPAELPLTLRAEVRPFLRVVPRIVMFNNVRWGEEHRQVVQLDCVDPDVVVESLTSDGEDVHAEVLERREGGKLSMLVTLRDSAPWGTSSAALRLRVKGRSVPSRVTVERELGIRVTAYTVGELRAAPLMFGVGRVRPGGYVRGQVTLFHPEGKPFEILDLHLDGVPCPGLSVASEPWEEAGRRGYVLLLTGEVGEHRGLFGGHAVVRTDLASEGEHRIAITGYVR